MSPYTELNVRGPWTSLTWVVIPSIIALAIWVYRILTFDKRRKYLPPGPKGWPLIGSLLDFADADKLPQITRKYADYGPVAYTKVGGTDFIWLNTPQAVKDLLDKRGSKYSSRPSLPMAFEVGSGGKRQIFMPYGNQWRTLRRITHACLNLVTADSYKPVQDFESKQVAYELLHTKDENAFYDITRRYSASLILTITYGHRVPDWNDPVITNVYKVMEHIVLMSEPGSWLVDAFPSLAKLPSWMVQNWRSIAQKNFDFDSQVYLGLYRGMLQQIKDGTAPACFVKDMCLFGPAEHGVDEVGAAYAAGSVVEAASESTSAIINAWILACTLYPRALEAAHEELDRVVGRDRMPSFDDWANLPYVRAMIKETLRWWPITKMGMNHATSEDDWYGEYFIPKGAVVILNWWAIHFDENRWKGAEEYQPMRYYNDPLTSAEALNTRNPEDRDHFTYGAGRRVCAGIHLAQNSLFMNVARTAWAFNIKPATRAAGSPAEFTRRALPGFVNTPARFAAVFEVRSPKHAQIIDETWSRAQDEGLEWTRRKRGKM